MQDNCRFLRDAEESGFGGTEVLHWPGAEQCTPSSSKAMLSMGC